MPPPLVFLRYIGPSSMVGIPLLPGKNTVSQHSGRFNEAQFGGWWAEGSLSPGLPRFLVFRIWFIAQVYSLRLCWRRGDCWLFLPAHNDFRAIRSGTTIQPFTGPTSLC